MNAFFKRIFDIVISFIALIILLPLFAIIAIAIKLDSKGPIFFIQERAGKNGVPFNMIKFRSMYTDVDPNGPSPSTKNDRRLTRVGRFLRETSLDELPQLINVLKGEMSLVGPRPLMVWQAEQFNDFERQRLLVRPGITGLAQVNGRGNMTWDLKLKYDIEYVNNCSIWLDATIIWRTLTNILRKEEVYETPYGAWKQVERGSDGK